MEYNVKNSNIQKLSEKNIFFEKIFNYLSGKKILHTIIKSSGILRLTLEELIDREIYIRMINQDLVVGDTFNPVMGWSKKEYEKRKKELNKNK